MSKKKIYIDAGHNYSGFGTGVAANDMKEQNITWEVCSLLKELLKDDFEITLSRPTLQTNLGHNNTSSINKRWEEANKLNSDYFISIHVNAGRGTGAETFYFRHGSKRSEKSQEFATYINNTYVKEMALRNRGVKPDTQTHIGSIGVLRHTKMPSILVELAFIDSPLQNPDVEILRTKTKEMVQALAKGIYAYFKIEQEKEVEEITADTHTDQEEKAAIPFDLFGKKVVNIDGYMEDGITWVRARQLLEEIGLHVGWDEEKGIVLVRHKTEDDKSLFKISEEDRHFAEQLVHFEARGESLEGQIAVAVVAFNRLKKPNRPNTLKDVILERHIRDDGTIAVQFSPTVRPDFGMATVSNKTREAVDKALIGVNPVHGATFFHAIDKLTDESFHARAEREGRLVRVVDIGNHRFWEED